MSVKPVGSPQTPNPIRRYDWTNADIVALGAALTGDISPVPFLLPAKTFVRNAYAIEKTQAAGGVKAQGTITMSGIAVAAETFVIGAQTFTWRAARTVAGEVIIGADAAAACTNIIAAVTLDLATVVASQGGGTTVIITAAAVGVAGNALTFTEASTNMAVDGAGTLGTTTAGEDLATLTLAVGRTGAAYIDYIKASSIMAAANTVYGATSGDRGTNLTGYDLPNIGATAQIKVHLIATGTNLANVTGSSGTIYLETEMLP